MKKIHSIILILGFVAFGGIAQAEEKTVSIPFSIPGELAKVEKVYRASADGPWLIHVQDPHCVIEAQKNIAALLIYIQKRYGLRHIYLEGGSGKLNAEAVRQFKNDKIKEALLEERLRQGVISGAEFAAVFSDKESSYFGIDHAALYDSNRKQLLQAEQSRARRNEILSLMRRQLLVRLHAAPKASAQAKKLAASLEELGILLEASKLNLTRENYGFFREIYTRLTQNPGAFFDLLGIPEQAEEWTDLASLFASVSDFYDLVLARDEAMGQNLLARVRLDRPRLALLVTGGFHADGIGKILAREGISTVVVSPQFKSWDGKENYLRVLEQVKLRQS